MKENPVSVSQTPFTLYLFPPPPPSPPPPPVDYWLAVIGEAEVTLVRRNERSGLFKKE